MVENEICGLHLADAENHQKEHNCDMVWKHLTLFHTLNYLKRPSKLQRLLEDIYIEFDKNPDEYVDKLCQTIQAGFPHFLNVIEDPDAVFRYAVVLYHFQYYGLCSHTLYLFIENWRKYIHLDLLKYAVLLAYETDLVVYGESYRERVDFKVHEYLKNQDKEYRRYFERLVYRETILHKLTNNCLVQSLEYVEDIFLVAKSLFNQKRYEDASDVLTMYKKVKYRFDDRSSTTWAVYNNNMGAIFMMMHLQQLAIKHIKTAHKLQKGTASDGDKSKIKVMQRHFYAENLGKVLTESYHCIDAFDVLLEAARHCPENPRLWVRIAKCCLRHCIPSGSNVDDDIASYKDIRSNFPKLDLNKKTTNVQTVFKLATLSLEFAIICLQKAAEVMNDFDHYVGLNIELIPIPGGSPITESQREHILNVILLLQSYIYVILEDPFAALLTANELLEHTYIPKYQQIMAHKYASEACCIVTPMTAINKRITPAAIEELYLHLPGQKPDLVFLSIWTRAAAKLTRKGEVQRASSILEKINADCDF